MERLLGAEGAARAALGQAVLYFGCRRADQDFLYGDLLRGWARDGHLTLFTAFSRQQVAALRCRPRSMLLWLSGHGPLVCCCSVFGRWCVLESWNSLSATHASGVVQARKVYVQDRLHESGDLVWRLLRAGAHVYVCGDAAGMAPAVEGALLDIVARAQGSGRPAAEKYMQWLAAAGRYQRDVWF